ncbi:MAG: aminoacyl-tRNA hydrolase [Bacteroidetes bacterium]|jgi:ribosome-associated protein|nr:aminoacyl-tRNA hydrolase [Bacteroidota bacterium]
MNVEEFIKELQFKAIRSSGAGGQHVNKTATKVEVSFNLEDSKALSAIEKEILRKKLATKISSEGVLRIQSDATRSQHKNKTLGIERMLELITSNLKKPKKRKKTKVPQSVIEKRLKIKKQQALKKKHRRPPEV